MLYLFQLGKLLFNGLLPSHKCDLSLSRNVPDSQNFFARRVSSAAVFNALRSVKRIPSTIILGFQLSGKGREVQAKSERHSLYSPKLGSINEFKYNISPRPWRQVFKDCKSSCVLTPCVLRSLSMLEILNIYLLLLILTEFWHMVLHLSLLTLCCLTANFQEVCSRKSC